MLDVWVSRDFIRILGFNDLCDHGTKDSHCNRRFAYVSNVTGALRTELIVVVFAALCIVVAPWAAADVDVFTACRAGASVTSNQVLLDDKRSDHFSAERADAFRLCAHDASLQRTHSDSGGTALRAVVRCAEACAALPLIATDGFLGIQAFSPVDLIFFCGSHGVSPVRH